MPRYGPLHKSCEALVVCLIFVLSPDSHAIIFQFLVCCYYWVIYHIDHEGILSNFIMKEFKEWRIRLSWRNFVWHLWLLDSAFSEFQKYVRPVAKRCWNIHKINKIIEEIMQPGQLIRIIILHSSSRPTLEVGTTLKHTFGGQRKQSNTSNTSHNLFKVSFYAYTYLIGL